MGKKLAFVFVVATFVTGITVQADPFALDPLGDGIVLGSGAVLGLVSNFFPYAMDHQTVDIASVNFIDRAAMFPYSKPIDLASDVTEFFTFAAPLLMAFAFTSDQDLTAGVIYAEAFSLALFAKNAGKSLFPRVRPWVYMAPESGTAPDVWEGNDSFPSGHATMAFAAAGFSITYAALYFPNSPWLIPFIAAEAGGAVVTASLRVFAGMHFITDVAAGALLGTAIGVAVPLLHQTGTAGPGAKSMSAARLEIPLLDLQM
jgi:membrane-associated phospholipid phosphatase